MRAMFGLVGILIVLAIIVWLMAGPGGNELQTVATANKNARQEVNQIAGNDTETGARASDSAELEGMTTNGKISSLLVSKVTPGGAYERYFGLKRDDSIVAVEYQGQRMNMKDINDEEMALAQVTETYQKKGSLVVVRNEKEITLPEAKPAASGSPVKAPARNDSTGLQGQLDTIQGAGGGVR